MRDSILTHALAAGGRGTVTRLLEVVDQLQSAHCGSQVLDRLIEHSVFSLAGTLETHMARQFAVRRGANWSTDLSVSIDLLSSAFNFSLGQRDGMCWCWIQPNDHWQPREFESRHDHPGGSGLVVAYTPALAMTSAIIILVTRFLLEPKMES